MSEITLAKMRELWNAVADTSQPTSMLLPKYQRELSKRYRGKGRPRLEDYDYYEIDYSAMFPRSTTNENQLQNKTGDQTPIK